MKKTILIIFLAIQSFNVFSQFNHSVGGGFVNLMQGDASISLPSLFYSPRINVSEINENMALSVGSHIGLGFRLSSSSNSRTGTESSESSFINFQLPVVAELNFGRKSTSDNEDNFGFFIGGGGALNYAASETSITSYGPLANAGVRFAIMDYPIGLRFGYLLDMNTTKTNVMTLNLAYDF